MITETFIQTPITTNTPREKTDVENERRISSDSLIETIKGFNKLTLDSTINNSADDPLKKIAKRDPKRDALVATHTSDVNERKLLILTLTKGIPHTNY